MLAAIVALFLATVDPAELIQAAMLGDTAAVKAEIAKGADVNARGTGRPAIVWAAQNGHLDVVQTLIAAKADVNIRDHIGLTALQRAVDTGDRRDVVQLLIKAGADVNLAYGEEGKAVYPGQTVLMMAASAGDREVVDLLLKAKANLNAKDNAGHTALHYAREKGDEAIVKALLEAGAKE